MKQFASIVIFASTLAMAQVYPGEQTGTLDKTTSDIKEVRTENKSCALKTVTGCRIGNALCGIRIDFHDCDLLRARTRACQDKTQVTSCYSDQFEQSETIVGITTAATQEAYADGLIVTTDQKQHKVGKINMADLKPIKLIPEGNRIIGLRFNSQKSASPEQKTFSWIQLMMHKEGTSWDEELEDGVEMVDSNFFAQAGSSSVPVPTKPTSNVAKGKDSDEVDAMSETAEPTVGTSPKETEGEGSNIGLIIGIIVGVLVVLGVIGGVLFMIRKQRMKEHTISKGNVNVTAVQVTEQGDDKDNSVIGEDGFPTKNNVSKANK